MKFAFNFHSIFCSSNSIKSVPKYAHGTEATIVQCIVRSLTTVDTLDANLSLIAFQSNSSDEAGVA